MEHYHKFFQYMETIESLLSRFFVYKNRIGSFFHFLSLVLGSIAYYLKPSIPVHRSGGSSRCIFVEKAPIMGISSLRVSSED